MTCSDPKHELMCREYDNLPALISLFGSLSWQKNQFFFTVESVAFAGVGVAFKSTFLDGTAPAVPALVLLIGICVFNFWICYVWFRTNRRNREYVDAILQRASAIEKELVSNDKATFSAMPKQRQHSSSRWELHIPSSFAVAWTVALLTAAWHGHHSDWAVSTLIAALFALLVFERPILPTH